MGMAGVFIAGATDEASDLRLQTSGGQVTPEQLSIEGIDDRLEHWPLLPEA
jgi:hypothetical protein